MYRFIRALFPKAAVAINVMRYNELTESHKTNLKYLDIEMVEFWILRNFMMWYLIRGLIIELTSTFTAARSFEIH